MKFSSRVDNVDSCGLGSCIFTRFNMIMGVP